MKKFKVFFHYIWQRPVLVIASLICSIIGTLLYSAQPFFLAELTSLATAANYADLKIVGLVFILTILLSVFFLAAAALFGNKSIVSVSTTILNDIMKKIHDLDFVFHANKSSGKILSLINRGDDAVFVFCDAFYFQCIELLVGLGFMFVSFANVNFKYSLLVLFNFVLTLTVSFFILKLNIKKRSEFNTQDNKLTTGKVDNLINFETVKYFAKEKYELKRFQKNLLIWQKSLLSYFFTFRFFDIAIGVINFFFLLGVFLFATADLYNGIFVVADFIFVLTFALGFNWRITTFIQILRQMAKKNEDLEKYLEILELKPSISDPADPKTIPNFQGGIEFRNVSFEYDNRKKLALKNINLQIKPGEVVALVGFSGAGKTTMVKLLQRMYDVTSGQITLDGINLKELTREYLRSQIGIVPQESLLFNNSIAYNIGYGKPEASFDEIQEAANLAEADDFIQNLPKKYETKVGERGVKLSGGQRQRLAIARVLLKQPKIIIFDEATSNLDSHSESAIQKAFWDFVRRKNDPATAIVIAHRLSTIMKADRIIVMQDGEIAEVGKHQELLTNKDSIYAHLWFLQSNGFIGDGETEETNS